ncbi:MAG: FKBP-type peptidyl-prolyl cis-trans isomerase [Chitinophagaceae bacterium]
MQRISLSILLLVGFSSFGQSKIIKKSLSNQPKHPFHQITLLKDANDSLSYSLGLSYAQWLIQQGITEINFKVFQNAITAIQKDQPVLIDDKTANMTIQEQLQALLKRKSSTNFEEGQKFLTTNKGKPGIITLPSGLQYQVLTEGTGPKPGPNDKVQVNYEGKLLNGKIFDSSIQRGQPITLGVNQVISGWTQALEMMPVGSKWRLFIPPNLAYGDRNAGPIPANSTLIFDVQLLGIEK